MNIFALPAGQEPHEALRDCYSLITANQSEICVTDLVCAMDNYEAFLELPDYSPRLEQVVYRGLHITEQIPDYTSASPINPVQRADYDRIDKERRIFDNQRLGIIFNSLVIVSKEDVVRFEKIPVVVDSALEAMRLIERPHSATISRSRGRELREKFTDISRNPLYEERAKEVVHCLPTTRIQKVGTFLATGVSGLRDFRQSGNPFTNP